MAKSEPERDEERENRIDMEIVVDCYDESERAMGWYCSLENDATFPFTATCVAKRSISPLKVKEKVEVIGLADSEDCERELFVTVRRGEDTFGVPLAQLMPTAETDETTKQIVEDWHYWVRMGYSF